MDIPVWQYILSIAVYTAILYVVHELSRKYLKGATVFFILAIFTFPLWLNNLDGWFRWGKTLIVLIPTCFTNLVRLSNRSKKEGWEFLRKEWPLYILYIVLNLNIIEASLKDLALGNYFNAISGFLLCITIPLPKKSWRISGSYGDLIADFPLMWCFLYTTWNACFVYAENPGYLASSICILLVPEIVSIIKGRSDLWLSARVYTLAFHLFIRATYDIFTPIMDSSSWANENVVSIWGIINIIVHISFAIWWFTKGNIKNNTKAKPKPI
ncbi:MAG: hypothetical protein FH751_13915 [Firmicutes bacterium]|nr:hypothetical protein [Bacillota bacterium]